MEKGEVKPFTKGQERFGSVLIKLVGKITVWLYRMTNGRVGNKFIGGAPVALLTTIGRKSGTPRTTPLLYLLDGENVVIVASKGGMSHNPIWYLNIRENPDVEIQINERLRRMKAREANDQERASLWPKLVDLYADFEEYKARATQRVIPIIILEPR